MKAIKGLTVEKWALSDSKEIKRFEKCVCINLHNIHLSNEFKCFDVHCFITTMGCAYILNRIFLHTPVQL
jgi:hypothetical protein